MTLEEQLVRDEGERLEAYQDSLGWWTIGVGHLIDPRKGCAAPMPESCTPEQSRAWLAEDVAKAKAALAAALPWTADLDEVRNEALVMISFILGAEGMVKDIPFTLAMIHEGKYERAARALGLSTLAKEDGPRIQRIAQQIRTGVRV